MCNGEGSGKWEIRTCISHGGPFPYSMRPDMARAGHRRSWPSDYILLSAIALVIEFGVLSLAQLEIKLIS